MLSKFKQLTYRNDQSEYILRLSGQDIQPEKIQERFKIFVLNWKQTYQEGRCRIEDNIRKDLN